MIHIDFTIYFSSQLTPAFAQGQSIEIEGKPFDSGAFGDIYHCVSFNGKRLSHPQVIKIFKEDGTKMSERAYDTIIKLQKKLIRYSQEASLQGKKKIQDIPALNAIPQFSFVGKLRGKTVRGYGALALSPKHYLNFSKLFEEEDAKLRMKNKKDFYARSLEDRATMAMQLVEGFQVLRSLSFIHADLNPHNFFVHKQKPILTLIDYDSGAITDQGKSEAETFGKLGDWLAPEIRAQLINQSFGNIKVNLHTDAWAVAVGIHFMFFWAHPLFYLKSQGKLDMQRYFRQNRYPQIQTTDANFRQQYQKTYQGYLSFLQTLPQEVRKAFELSFNEGYHNSGQRVSYNQWQKILSNFVKTTQANTTQTITPKSKQTKKKTTSAIHQKTVKSAKGKIKASKNQLANIYSLNPFQQKTKTSISPSPQKQKPPEKSLQNTFSPILKSIFQPPDVKELKKRLQLLEKQNTNLQKALSKKESSEQKSKQKVERLEQTELHFKGKTERLLQQNQDLLKERSALRSENRVLKSEANKLKRKVKLQDTLEAMNKNSTWIILGLMSTLIGLIAYIALSAK